MRQDTDKKIPKRFEVGETGGGGKIPLFDKQTGEIE